METVVLSAASKGDWLGVLQLPKEHTQDMINTRYKRLALILHPDKNKSAQAEETFKALSKAVEELKKPRFSRPRRRRTFWTRCPHCRVQYEYQAIYLNRKLQCPNEKCHKPFDAKDCRFEDAKRKRQREDNDSKKRSKTEEYN